MAYWLMKSEPSAFSIYDLSQVEKEGWDGVRNYQARNFMTQMRVGDDVLFYHASCKDVGIVGQMRVVTEAYPDPSQFDPESTYFDPKATLDTPRWFQVDVSLVCKWRQTLSLKKLKSIADLADMDLLKKGSRLSVMPVSESHWQCILDHAHIDG